MSSTYRVLCLSHDPAIVAADGDWNRPEFAEAAIREGIEGHETCDLLLGRYSYPLVEVGCPANPKRDDGLACGWHSRTQWVDRGWLQLLYLAQHEPSGKLLAGVKDQTRFRCWTPQRLHRIADDLDVTRLV